MAEPFSIERRKIMRMLGAKVIVTPKAGKGTGMVEKAVELAEKNGGFSKVFLVVVKSTQNLTPIISCQDGSFAINSRPRPSESSHRRWRVWCFLI